MSRLRGTIVPLVTPFAEGGDAVDEATLGRLVEHLLKRGADALMPTALTGEGPLLAESETLEVWDTVFGAAEGRAPVWPAILSFTTSLAVRLARRAEALGARGLMVAPIVPELYAGRSERDVEGFYERVSDATSLPIVLFNYPSLTGIDFRPALVERLLKLDAVRYVKESTGDSRRVSALTRRFGDRLEVICGAPGAALECFALGCTAWITGILNVLPREGRSLLTAVAEDSDLARARRIFFGTILPVVELLDATSNPTGTIKAGLELRGIPVGAPRPPGQGLLAEERAKLGELLSES